MGGVRVQKLPTGVCNRLDILQEKIYESFEGIDTVCAYIDYILVITKDKFEGNMKAIKIILYKLEESG